MSSGSVRPARRHAASPGSLSDTPRTGSSSVSITKAASATKASKAAVEPAPMKAPKKAKSAKQPNGVNGEAIALADGNASSKTTSRARDDKDRPLFEDIRYLGRLLGDVLREQEGAAVFDVVEAIRQPAVKFRREDDVEASQTLEKAARAVAGTDSERGARVQLFLHLANIAEDWHYNRRRIHTLAGSALQPGTIAYAIETMREKKNVSATRKLLQKFFDDALIVPLLTAHPTEVSRKSILDAQHDIARMARRARSARGVSGVLREAQARFHEVRIRERYRMRTTLLYAATLLCVGALAWADQPECANAPTQMAMNECVGKNLKAADQKMNDAYRALLAKVSKDGGE